MLCWICFFIISWFIFSQRLFGITHDIFFLYFLPSVLDTDEELMEWKTKFDDRVAVLESNISKLEREMSDTETKISSRKQFMTNYIWEISKLQTEANVILLASCCFSLGFC